MTTAFLGWRPSSKKPSLVMPCSAPGIGSTEGRPPQAIRMCGAVSVRVPRPKGRSTRTVSGPEKEARPWITSQPAFFQPASYDSVRRCT